MMHLGTTGDMIRLVCVVVLLPEFCLLSTRPHGVRVLAGISTCEGFLLSVRPTRADV